MTLPKKIRIISDGTPPGTMFLDERGNDFPLYINQIKWSIKANGGAEATVEIGAMLVPADIDGRARYEILDPNGSTKEIVSIKFADGTEWVTS